jgi:hypothetical protein
MEKGIKKLNFLLYFNFLILVLEGNIGCRKVEECISLEGAREVVLYQVVGIDTVEWDTTKIRVYELPYMLEKGDTITVAKIAPEEEYPEVNYKDTTFILKENYWYFYINDTPLLEKRIGRHVFVYCSRKYEVIYSIGPLPYYYEMVEIKW